MTAENRVSLRGACLGALLAGALWAAAQPPASSALSDPLADGRAALADELYDLARRKLEPWLKAGGGTPEERLEGALLLARAYYGEGRLGDMRRALEEVQERVAGTSQAAAWTYLSAQGWGAAGQWSRALDTLRDFERDHAASEQAPSALRLMAQAHLALRQTNAALACMTRFALAYPHHPEAGLNLLEGGQTLLAAGRVAEARDVLERLLAQAPDGRIGQECRTTLGRLYLGLQLWEPARHVLQPLIEHKLVPDPYRAQALFILAELAEALHHPLEALTLLERVEREVADPLWQGEAGLRRGHLLLNMGKSDDGAALVRAFVAAQPTHPLARAAQLRLADTLLARALYEKALAEYGHFLEAYVEPSDVARARMGKGWALFALARYHEAAAAFEQAEAGAVTPAEGAVCRFKIGDCRYALDQVGPALEAYDRVATAYPDTPLGDRALYQAAECRARLGAPRDAEGIWLDLADRDPYDPLAVRALVRAAQSRQQSGAWDAAGALYRDLDARYAGWPQALAWHGLGVIQYRTGAYEEAGERFQQVVREYPASEVADVCQYLSGWCRYLLDDDAGAARHFQDTIRLYPQSAWAPEAWFWLGEQAYNRGAYAEAEDALTTLARTYPRALSAEVALFWAGRAALMQQEYRRAKRHLTQLLKDYPAGTKRAEARFYQGEALCALGDFADAILVFEEALKQASEGELADTARLRQGDCRFTLAGQDPKRYGEALESYQAVVGRTEASPAARLQAEYKSGRCLEKMGRAADAFERYMNVVYAYAKVERPEPATQMWFTRAAFAAAGLKEAEQNWRKAVSLYERVTAAGVPAAADAEERRRQIQAAHWLFFY